jgi:hypothetical protein
MWAWYGGFRNHAGTPESSIFKECSIK